MPYHIISSGALGGRQRLAVLDATATAVNIHMAAQNGVEPSLPEVPQYSGIEHHREPAPCNIRVLPSTAPKQKTRHFLYFPLSPSLSFSPCRVHMAPVVCS